MLKKSVQVHFDTDLKAVLRVFSSVFILLQGSAHEATEILLRSSETGDIWKCAIQPYLIQI